MEISGLVLEEPGGGETEAGVRHTFSAAPVGCCAGRSTDAPVRISLSSFVFICSSIIFDLCV